MKHNNNFNFYTKRQKLFTTLTIKLEPYTVGLPPTIVVSPGA